MASIEKNESEYMSKDYELLKYAVILDVQINAVIDEDDPNFIQFVPSLKVRLEDGQGMWVDVDCDPEGNGPGHLSAGSAK